MNAQITSQPVTHVQSNYEATINEITKSSDHRFATGALNWSSGQIIELGHFICPDLGHSVGNKLSTLLGATLATAVDRECVAVRSKEEDVVSKPTMVFVLGDHGGLI